MFSFLSEILQKKSIDCFAPIPLKACRVRKPYLLERAGITDGTAVILAIPYYTRACANSERNISAYAVSRDYHRFFQDFFDEILPILRTKFPQHRFAGFADHSPIAETEAAARAGLGVIGKNHLLLTEKYSSYIFLGEIITDAQIPCEIYEISECENCGACMKKCPAKDCGTCLSALTQKKGVLNTAEEAAILKYGSAWGCDICQEVCPHTQKALKNGTIFSPIPYFGGTALAHLTVKALDAMTDEEFTRRAYAWRGRETVRRNLLLFEKGAQTEGDSVC